MSKFLPSHPKERRNLADIIMEKIKAHEEGEKPEEPTNLDPKVMEVYTKVGELLSRYKSGKVPKAFKIIPTLSNWEEILQLTQPDQWTPNTMYVATKLFVSNLKPESVPRYTENFANK